MDSVAAPVRFQQKWVGWESSDDNTVAPAELSARSGGGRAVEVGSPLHMHERRVVKLTGAEKIYKTLIISVTLTFAPTSSLVKSDPLGMSYLPPNY